MEQLWQELSVYPWSLGTLKIWAECDFRCVYCDQDMLGTLDTFKLAQIDHLLPQGAYPQLVDSPSNHVLCCWVCNKIKRHWDANTRVGQPLYAGGDQLTSEQRTALVQRAKNYVAEMRVTKTPELLATREAVMRYRERTTRRET